MDTNLCMHTYQYLFPLSNYIYALNHEFLLMLPISFNTTDFRLSLIFPTCGFFFSLESLALITYDMFAYLFNFFFKDVFIHETQRGRDTGRGRSRLPARSPMWDSIPGPREHDLSWRQTFNHWATQASVCGILGKICLMSFSGSDSLLSFAWRLGPSRQHGVSILYPRSEQVQPACWK